MRTLTWNIIEKKNRKIEFLNVSILVDEPEGSFGMGIYWNHAADNYQRRMI